MTTDIDRTVSDTFDELFIKINSNEKFHPSEKANSLCFMSKLANSKIFDFINAYHGFCKICNQHFYTRSVADDINSFFQKHINTMYHRQMRTVQLPPDDRPMFTWEKELLTGRCHVCNMSGLNSYILDTKYLIVWLMKVHHCVWDQSTLEANNEFLWKLSLLRKYCGVKIFRDKMIKTINGKSFCLLCQRVVPWIGKESVCHLTSDSHYLNFCAFLQDHFSFTLKEVFNGFNLEAITRWMATHDLKILPGFSDIDERILCLELSNDERSPYPEDDNCSFSPKHVEDWFDDENFDFILKKECFLCNVKATPWHMNSGPHQAKAKNVMETSFNDPEKYAMFWKNRLKRQRIKRNYLMLMEDLKKSELTEKNFTNDSETSYLKTLLEKKLQSVNLMFTLSDFGEMFCEVCDKHGIIDPDDHINSETHSVQKKIWIVIGEMCKDPRFMEPFKQIKKVIICFLCGVVLNSNTFCAHLKSASHTQQLEEYFCSSGPPISSSFEMTNKFSCKCSTCGLRLNETVKLPKLKDALKKIMQHWPCPNASHKSKTNYGMELTKVENAIESLVSVFEEKILERVTQRTLCHVRHFGRTEVGNRSKGSPTSRCRMSPLRLCTEKPDEKKIQFSKMQEKKTEIVKEIDVGDDNYNNDNDKDDDDDDDVDDDDENKENVIKEKKKNHEVLVIRGLPKSKKIYDIIYSNFKVFGKISFVFVRDDQAFVGFTQKGVAQKVCAKGAALYFEHKLTFSVSRGNAIADSETELKPLNKNLVDLLENEVTLMGFVIRLVQEAEKAFNSPSERKREEAVCRAIIQAMYKDFPNGRCYPFGSRLSGLTLNDSDLDVFLDCGGMYEGFKSLNLLTENSLVKKLAKILRKNPEIKVTKVVERARVPIVSFFHPSTQTNCDLSFKNGLSIQNTLLIRLILLLDLRVKPIILFLKYWVKVNELHGPPFFSSYAIVMLVVFYLEQVVPPVLPTIESLLNGHVGPRTTIAGWDCSINIKLSDFKKTTNHDGFLSLLAGFFRFYAGFDYKQNVISPLTGTPIPREFFSESGFSKLPLCYKRQIFNLPQPIESLISEKYFICIIDPFDLSHNLTKCFTSWGLQVFKHYCKLTTEILEKTKRP